MNAKTRLIELERRHAGTRPAFGRCITPKERHLALVTLCDVIRDATRAGAVPSASGGGDVDPVLVEALAAIARGQDEHETT